MVGKNIPCDQGHFGRQSSFAFMEKKSTYSWRPLRECQLNKRRRRIHKRSVGKNDTHTHSMIEKNGQYLVISHTKATSARLHQHQSRKVLLFCFLVSLNIHPHCQRGRSQIQRVLYCVIPLIWNARERWDVPDVRTERRPWCDWLQWDQGSNVMGDKGTWGSGVSKVDWWEPVTRL